MKTAKRITALVLLIALLLPAIPAAAADEGALSWLGVELGSGSRTIQRQELFTALCKIRSGGIVCEDEYYWSALTASGFFKDLDKVSESRRYAAAYCFYNRIFVGDGDGHLNPTGTLTYGECAAALLRLLGADEHLLRGKLWLINVAELCDETGIYDGLPASTLGEPITAGGVEIMLGNALGTKLIGGNQTLLEVLYGLQKVDSGKRVGYVVGLDGDDLSIWSGELCSLPKSLYVGTAQLGARLAWGENGDGAVVRLPIAYGEPTVYDTVASAAGKLSLDTSGITVTFGAGQYCFSFDVVSVCLVRRESVSEVSIFTLEKTLSAFGETDLRALCYPDGLVILLNK